MLGLGYLDSSDEEVLDSGEEESISEVLDSRGHAIITSENEDGSKGGDGDTSLVETAQPGNRARDMRWSPDWGFTRYNGKRECDWRSARLDFVPRSSGRRESDRAASRLSATPERNLIATSANVDISQRSESPGNTQVTPGGANNNHQNSGGNRVLFTSDGGGHAAGQDPVNNGTERFASMFSERSVCRTRNTGVSETRPRRLSFHTTEGEVGEVI